MTHLCSQKQMETKLREFCSVSGILTPIKHNSPPHTDPSISIVTGEPFWALHWLITTLAIPFKKLVTHQRGGAEDGGVAALSWEQGSHGEIHSCSFLGTECWKESKSRYSLSLPGQKEFSLYFFWFQEWLGSLASLKLLSKCSVSLLTIKGII